MSDGKVKLRLKAVDTEDLDVLASHLQDAIFPITTMIFDKEDSIFTLMANRFCWEEESEIHEGVEYHARVHTALAFKHVKSLFKKGFHQHMEKERSLSLLTIHVDADHKEGEKIHLLFSGNKEICLLAEKIECFFADLEEPWMSPIKPTHIHDYEENDLTKGEKDPI